MRPEPAHVGGDVTGSRANCTSGQLWFEASFKGSAARLSRLVVPSSTEQREHVPQVCRHCSTPTPSHLPYIVGTSGELLCSAWSALCLRVCNLTPAPHVLSASVCSCACRAVQAFYSCSCCRVFSTCDLLMRCSASRVWHLTL